MSIRRQIAVSTAAATLSLLIVTCGPAGVESMRDAMVGGDGGTIDLLDAMTPDAAAEPITMTASCNIERRQFTEYDDGRYLRTTQWYAEIEVPGLDVASIHDVTAVLSDYEVFGTSAGSACPDNATCTYDPDYQLREGMTATITMPWVAGNRLRVHCGFRQEYQLSPPATPMPVLAGERAGSVRFVIER